MKFLPENKKKRLWSLVILAVAVAGIVYLNFFALGDTSPEAPSAPAAVSPDTDAPLRTSSLLPFGRSIDTSILDSQRFQRLQAPPELTVSPDELGKANLFSPSTERPAETSATTEE